MNTPQTTAAVCEKKRKNDSPCGIRAIGCCSTCGEAFCMTHQARRPQTNEGYVDECTFCFTQRLEDAKERLSKAQARADEARQYFLSGLARAALLRAGIYPIEILAHGEKLKKGIFGDRYIEMTFSQHGWILGEFHWRWSYQVSWARGYGTTDSYETKFGKFLTALEDIPMSHENAFATFIPVNKGPKGYESFYGRNNRDFPQGGCLCSELYPVGWDGNRYLENWPSELEEDHTVKGWVWVELEQAVRRLTGEPS